MVAVFAIIAIRVRQRMGAEGSEVGEGLGLAFGYIGAIVLGLALGSEGPGADIGRGIGGFLLTRPWSRGRLIWTSWLTGLLELAALIGVAIACLAGTPIWREPSTVLWSIALMAAPYGLTYLLSTMLRDGRRAIIGSIAVLATYGFAVKVLDEHAGILLPTLTALGTGADAVRHVIGWALAAAACPVIAHVTLARADL